MFVQSEIDIDILMMRCFNTYFCFFNLHGEVLHHLYNYGKKIVWIHQSIFVNDIVSNFNSFFVLSIKFAFDCNISSTADIA